MNKPLSAGDKRDWAQLMHTLILDGLMQDSAWTKQELVFHGGTSLHLSWGSPRFSEDLDFLLSRLEAGKLDQNLDRVMTRVLRRAQRHLTALDPTLQLEVKKRKAGEGAANRMADYHFLVSKPGVLGKAMVKAEFWKVDPEYLASYASVFRTPIEKGDLIGRVTPTPVPAATLESALADKMVAFATRPFLKWRDLFDVWWIRSRAPAFEGGADDAAAGVLNGADPERFLHHLSAYSTVEGLPPSAALRRFADDLTDRKEAIIKAAEIDLKPFLPPTLWGRLYPDEVTEMLRLSQRMARNLADRIEALGLDARYVPPHMSGPSRPTP